MNPVAPVARLVPSLMGQISPPCVAPAQRNQQPRGNILTAVINAAQRHALDPDDAYSVWAEIIRMANQPNPPAPLLGHSSDGITYTGNEYQNTGIPDVLTHKNLADRLRRGSAR